ncbi:hypothetical protein [Bartonella sp. ML70XJBT]|uniref:hypothetical protein n=1 Tax=Bartonella sp. ML70XJBT TaxID=3019096 RepID=UPI00235F4CC7|nr:hypothetical protein [Bartonella sp. ML70XJBT]
MSALEGVCVGFGGVLGLLSWGGMESTSWGGRAQVGMKRGGIGALRGEKRKAERGRRAC